MKTEAVVSRRTIYLWLETIYRITPQAITFIPEGECSWNYRVTDRDSTEYLLKLARPDVCSDRPMSEQTIKTLMALYYDFGITQMTPPPLRATTGQYINMLHGYTTVVRPFIDGIPVTRLPMDENHGRKLGALLATLHSCKLHNEERPPVEDFSPQLNDALQHILKEAAYPTRTYNAFQIKFLRILRRITPRIKKLSDAFLKIQARLMSDRRLSQRFVICHGEPSGGNVLITPDDGVMLIDWDNPVYAPPERDLIHIAENPAVVDGYKRVNGGEFPMRRDIAHFYRLCWNMQEIVDYCNRLLFQQHSKKQNKHDIIELVEHLKGIGLL